MPKKKKETELLVKAIVEGMLEKKGHEIVVMDFNKITNSFCDYFVVCHGSSKVQVQAIAESVEEQVYKKLNIKNPRKEGAQNAEWILLDYFNVIVHVFVQEARNFYKIESLWADADLKYIKEEKVTKV